MGIDLPPKLWLPPWPAIIRPANPKLLLPDPCLSMIPGMASAAALMGSGGVVPASVVYQTTAFNGTNQSTYTFSSQPFGTADATRHIIVGFSCNKLTADLTNPTSCTIGGVSAAAALDSGGGASTCRQFWIAAVPTGTTGNVVIVRAANMTYGACHIWAAYDLLSATAIDTDIFSGDPANLSVDTLVGGIAVGLADDHGAATATAYTVTGLTEDAEGDGSGTGSSVDWCAASKSPTLTETLAISFDPAAVVSTIAAAVSFR